LSFAPKCDQRSFLISRRVAQGALEGLIQRDQAPQA